MAYGGRALRDQEKGWHINHKTLNNIAFLHLCEIIILLSNHDCIAGGRHRGHEDTNAAHRAKYYWPNMYSDIEQNLLTGLQVENMLMKFLVICSNLSSENFTKKSVTANRGKSVMWSTWISTSNFICLKSTSLRQIRPFYAASYSFKTKKLLPFSRRHFSIQNETLWSHKTLQYKCRLLTAN